MTELGTELCEDCPLVDVTFKKGCKLVIANEARITLSETYPIDDEGEIPELPEGQVETLAQSAAERWRRAPAAIGQDIATLIETNPELVRANYECERRISLGKCATVRKEER